MFMTILESYVYWLRKDEEMANAIDLPETDELRERKKKGTVKKKPHPLKKEEAFVDEKTTPKHYTELAITPIDVIECWELGFHLGTALKYLARRGTKEGESETYDLKKSVWYIQRYIKNLEASTNEGD